MSTIEELEGRLTAAMERIAAFVAALEAPQAAEGGGDTAALQAALDEEKLANAQLKERVRKLTEQQQDAVTAVDTNVTQRIEALDLELQRLRKATEQLRESNAALRDANAAGLAEPHLINKSMMAELEALRASRAADVAEADTILMALDGLLSEEVADA